MNGADKALKRKVLKSSNGFMHSSCCYTFHSAFSICGCGLASPLPVGQVLLRSHPHFTDEETETWGLDVLSKGM